MAIFRSLKTLISRTSKNSRSFLTLTAAFPSPYAPLIYSNYRFSYPSHRTLLPLSKWIDFPVQHGPLFLSSPPWKLAQSATPLYLRGNAVVLRKVQELNHLIRNRGAFPLKLRVASVSPETVPWDRPMVSERREDCSEESFVNLPNLISMSRLISGPFIGLMITNEMYSSACVALAVSGATDWLDGYAARKMKINSVVGSYLDPLADKVLIGCVAFAMVQNDLLHPGLVGLIVARDVLLVGGAVYKRATSVDWKSMSWSDFFNLDGTRAERVQPLFLSKVNTVFQLVLVAAALLQPEFGTQETQVYITYLSWLVASTTVASTAAYGVQYMRRSAVTH